ncbi:MAG: hypothetical protein HYZ90_00730 [Candidatus Omnitrophica bacterium]|nr:hypothetical protein [Candidatus Omnitrophota bacterium]
MDKKVVSCGLWMSIVLLLLAIPSGWPYGYYTLLRWVVCSTAGYLAYVRYKEKGGALPFFFGIIAVLFNPIVPVRLSKSDWSLMDFGVAIFLFIYGIRSGLFKFSIQRQLAKRMAVGGGVAVGVLALWGLWSWYRHATYDYPVSLVKSEMHFDPARYLKNTPGEININGWRVLPVSNTTPHTYLVSFTYSKQQPTPNGPIRLSDVEKFTEPIVQGWWWEVNTGVPLVRPVVGDSELGKKYGIVSVTDTSTNLTPDELSKIQLSSYVSLEGGGNFYGIPIVPSKLLLLTVHNGTGRAVSGLKVNVLFYYGSYLVNRQRLWDLSGASAQLEQTTLQPGRTANYKIKIDHLYPDQQVDRYELELASASPERRDE